MKLVFDLDGTIAPYKKEVPEHIADFLNTLGHIYIVTGGKSEYARAACRRLKNATITGMADKYASIDVAGAMSMDKDKFNDSFQHQLIRLSLTQQLTKSLINKGICAFTGGRSTIDIMAIGDTKAEAVDGEILYFYDCKWDMNIEYSNDWPMIKKAKVAIRTTHENIIGDVQKYHGEFARFA